MYFLFWFLLFFCMCFFIVIVVVGWLGEQFGSEVFGFVGVLVYVEVFWEFRIQCIGIGGFGWRERGEGLWYGIDCVCMGQGLEWMIFGEELVGVVDCCEGFFQGML